MSRAAELLEALRLVGATAELTVEGKVSIGPADLVPAGLMTELKANRDALAAELAQQRGSVSGAWRADPASLAWPSQVGEDPRPDLPGSELWGTLLTLAAGDWDDPRGTYGRVLGARACGALLERQAGRWKLAPVIDPSERLSVWQDRESWDRDAATWLGPRTKEITALLRQLPAPARSPEEARS